MIRGIYIKLVGKSGKQPRSNEAFLLISVFEHWSDLHASYKRSKFCQSSL